MRLVITGHILFGTLRPWTIDRNSTTALIKKKSSDLPGDGADFAELLENYPQIVKELQSEFQIKEERSSQDKLFVAVKNVKPFDRVTWWYFQLLQAEKNWFLHYVITQIQNLEKAADIMYEVNLSVRYLVDLLINTNELLGYQEDKEILKFVEQHLMQLVLDISLRFQHLDGVEVFDEELLFVTILDRKPPERSLFYKTVAYWRYRLEGLLKEEDPDGKVVKLRKEILQFGKEPEQQSIDEEKFTGLLRHLENIIFLLIYEAPFIDKHPEKLLDEKYCAEWVYGIRNDFMSEEDPEQASTLFKDLLDISGKFEQLLNVSTGTPEDKLNYVSEARYFLYAVKEVFVRPLQIGKMALNNRGKNPDNELQNTDFAESFHRRFMTIEDFDSVLPGKREATMRYIENGNIRILEISREVKFLYRADVERFLEERTIG